jgi:hypothetical protein
MHLCFHCGVNPNNNDLFVPVETAEQAVHNEFSRVLEMPNAEKNVPDFLRIRSQAKLNITNDSTARPSRPTEVDWTA